MRHRQDIGDVGRIEDMRTQVADGPDGDVGLVHPQDKPEVELVLIHIIRVIVKELSLSEGAGPRKTEQKEQELYAGSGGFQ